MTTATPPLTPPARPARSRLDLLFRAAVIVLAAVVLGVVLLIIGQSAIYKVHEYERGLHLRGGQFLGQDDPGWHIQIPFVDTVILVKVNERLGYVERITTATADNLSMVVSLQYTYRVTEPRTFALDVDDPERILFELVQGRLRDVANTRSMQDMMGNRAEFNQAMLSELRTKEQQYGVQFITVQLQSAEPPANVVQAIEDRMVATQKQSQAEAEAAQQRVLADAQFYAAQKEADAEAYQIQTRAVAQQESVRLLLSELSQHPEIADKYLDYLMAQELKSNSKWIIGSGGAPTVDFRLEADPVTPTPAAP
ncbi:MAG: SPFH domain-containing protein [Anaerolineales bacterium]|nr:SPFH domain-containing protein [Anaerolineales bacterium]